MAKNTGRGSRRGSVNDRTQFQTPNGNWAKRDRNTGRIMDQKTTGGPFKPVRYLPPKATPNRPGSSVARGLNSIMSKCVTRTMKGGELNGR